MRTLIDAHSLVSCCPAFAPVESCEPRRGPRVSLDCHTPTPGGLQLRQSTQQEPLATPMPSTQAHFNHFPVSSQAMPCRGLQCEEGQGEQQASRPAGEEVGDQEGQLGRSWQTLQLPEPEWLPFPELDGLPLARVLFSAPHIPNGSLLCFPRPILLQGLFRGEQSPAPSPPFYRKPRGLK